MSGDTPSTCGKCFYRDGDLCVRYPPVVIRMQQWHDSTLRGVDGHWTNEVFGFPQAEKKCGEWEGPSE